MKIAMVFDGLGVGGIERVGIDYMKLLSEVDMMLQFIIWFHQRMPWSLK